VRCTASTIAANRSGSTTPTTPTPPPPPPTWAVGRAVNPQHRRSDEARADDYVFQGFELNDALVAANEALEDDAVVSEQDGSGEKVRPFVREELLGPLERWFFGR
jgi:hypothetical protein